MRSTMRCTGEKSAARRWTCCRRNRRTRSRNSSARCQAGEEFLRGRLVITPHAAFYSPDAIVDIRRKTVEVVLHYLRDGRLTNCVNAQYLRKERSTMNKTSRTVLAALLLLPMTRRRAGDGDCHRPVAGRARSARGDRILDGADRQQHLRGADRHRQGSAHRAVAGRIVDRFAGRPDLHVQAARRRQLPQRAGDDAAGHHR